MSVTNEAIPFRSYGDGGYIPSEQYIQDLLKGGAVGDMHIDIGVCTASFGKLWVSGAITLAQHCFSQGYAQNAPLLESGAVIALY